MLQNIKKMNLKFLTVAGVIKWVSKKFYIRVASETNFSNSLKYTLNNIKHFVNYFDKR